MHATPKTNKQTKFTLLTSDAMHATPKTNKTNKQTNRQSSPYLRLTYPALFVFSFTDIISSCTARNSHNKQTSAKRKQTNRQNSPSYLRLTYPSLSFLLQISSIIPLSMQLTQYTQLPKQMKTEANNTKEIHRVYIWLAPL